MQASVLEHEGLKLRARKQLGAANGDEYACSSNLAELRRLKPNKRV